MRTIYWFGFIVLAFLWGCQEPLYDVNEESALQECSSSMPNRVSQADDNQGSRPIFAGVGRALMATRFGSFDEFKTVVEIEYLGDTTRIDTSGEGANIVRLRHCSMGFAVTSVLVSGVSQRDIMKVKNAGIWDKMGLVFKAPIAVMNRADLERVYVLARRMPMQFGEGDPAFYDLAETSVANITTPDLAFRYPRDTTEKGYINSFNHMTAQAFISSIFSEELADLVADLHELKNMSELTSGRFTQEQLLNPDDNPVDNYVDMINNEWGQELGKELRNKYHITRETFWTPILLANYLNDIQSYYSWAFRIGFKPYRPEDELVTMFATKINYVLGIKNAEI
jgi:hypothetical protein